MNLTERKAMELTVEALEKLIEKYKKKADKEKVKRDTAEVTYNGEVYHSEAELQDAYACDCFSSAVYDRLLTKLEKATGRTEDKGALTESELLVLDLQKIRANFKDEIRHDDAMKMKKERQEKRFQELLMQGYSYKEASTIISNEEMAL